MASTTAPSVAQRAAAANVTISIGTFNLLVDILPSAIPNKDESSQFHQLCGCCETPTRLRQALFCPEDAGHGPFFPNEITRHGKTLDDADKTLVEVTAEEIAEVRGVDLDTADDSKMMTLVPVRSAGVMEATLNGDAVYRIRPAKKGSPAQGYELLRILVTQALRKGKVLIGELAIRNTKKLFWLSIRHDQVIAQALMRPDDIAPFDSIPTVDLPERVSTMAAELIEQMTVDFDPAEFSNQVRARALALLEAKAADPLATITPISSSSRAKAPAADDLESLLSDMLSA